MADCRDWLATLWPASFKGFPFYVEKDEQEGSRRVVVHEFPMRDDPFLEDLGEGAAYFSASAYVANDAADADAIAFVGILAAIGPGLLVLPTQGPRLVRALTWRREASRDRHGYIAFEVRFAREGAAGALASAPFRGQLVFAAVDLLATAAAVAFSSAVVVEDVADFVIEDTVASVENVAASIEATRVSLPVAPETSAAVRDLATTIFDTGPDLVSRETGADPAFVSTTFEAVRTMGEGLEGDAGVSAFADMADDWQFAASGVYPTANRRAADVNLGAVARVARLAAIGAYAEAMTRRTFGSRGEGITARADAAERFDAELELSAGAENADVFIALQGIRGALVEYLSRVITDLAPVVSIEVPLSMPSLWWAWRLYADPSRAAEIVARNDVPHASFIPTEFEALAR